MPLDRYRRKRDFGRTPEPAGGPAGDEGRGPQPSHAGVPGGARSGPRFVVQRHRATRLHYDFRLEIEGVLASWAVPRGPSLRPLERRMAARTEDHPIEYLDFEGVIPAGEYGGGDVIVWDWGTWQPEDGGDPAAAVRAGELKLVLEGERLRGRFVLVRTRSRDDDPGRQDWLLIHKRDEHADPGWDIDAFPTSVKTGRTNDEVRDGRSPLFQAPAPGEEEPVDLSAAVAEPMPDFLPPMAASAVAKPFSDPGWLYELKLDGYRIECVIRDGAMRAWTRNRQDAGRWFPDFVAQPPTWIAAREAIVDGEMVAVGEDGRPDFSLLQDVSGLRGLGGRRGERGAGGPSGEDVPAGRPGASSLVYFCFDLLYLDGWSLLAVPLRERKRLLARLLRPGPRAQPLPHVEGGGAAFHEAISKQGLEGTIAKRRDSPYEPGKRSRAWLKVKAVNEQEFAVVGYEPGKGSHAELGAILVATHEPRGWRFAGEVGSGLDARSRALLKRLLDEHRVDDPPVIDPPRLPGARWSEPREVVRVAFTEWTSDDLLRHPVYRGRELGRDPRSVRRERPLSPPPARGAEGDAGRRAEDGPARPAAPARGADGDAPAQSAAPEELAALDTLGASGTWHVGGHELHLTNLDKVLFPEAGFTKRDLVRYYTAAAPVLLPYLRDRALNTHRWPDGVEGRTHFWQKQIPAHAPDWVARWEDPDATAGRSHTYIVAERVATLAWLAGQAVIDMHPWTSRIDAHRRPTYALIDIDPGTRTTWEEVLVMARLYRTALEHVGVRGFPKVTGKRGIQVWVPLTPRYSFDDTRDWVEKLSRAVGSAVPGLVSWEWGKADRRGLARLDFTQNAVNKTLVAPYAVRPMPRASVSMPIEWHELDDPDLRPDRWDIRSALVRIEERGDPFRGVLGSAQDLPSI
jgi:bifunctional non-homologous end joining protein LigD